MFLSEGNDDRCPPGFRVNVSGFFFFMRIVLVLGRVRSVDDNFFFYFSVFFKYISFFFSFSIVNDSSKNKRFGGVVRLRRRLVSNCSLYVSAKTHRELFVVHYY